jgi:hypothetical protein
VGMGWWPGSVRERRRGAGGEAGATACGGGSPGKPRNRVPGLGFERGLDGEVERDEGNPIRGLRGRGGGRRQWPAARGNGDLWCAPSGHGRSGGEGKGGRPSVLTTTRCSGRVCSTAGSGGTTARRRPEARATMAAAAGVDARV